MLSKHRMQAFRLMWRKRRLDWADRGASYAAVPPRKDACPLTDAALNFFLRVQLERRYRRVIEIGAYSGERIATLKRLFPEAECFGLDVAEGYSFDRAGVSFRPLEELSALALPGSLTVCQGTLAYVPDLPRLLGELRGDLAFAEPAGIAPIVETEARSGVSLYHPYERMLSEAGFEIVDVSKRFGTLAMAENWIFAYAVRPTPSRSASSSRS